MQWLTGDLAWVTLTCNSLKVHVTIDKCPPPPPPLWGNGTSPLPPLGPPCLAIPPPPFWTLVLRHFLLCAIGAARRTFLENRLFSLGIFEGPCFFLCPLFWPFFARCAHDGRSSSGGVDVRWSLYWGRSWIQVTEREKLLPPRLLCGPWGGGGAEGHGIVVAK